MVIREEPCILDWPDFWFGALRPGLGRALPILTGARVLWRDGLDALGVGSDGLGFPENIGIHVVDGIDLGEGPRALVEPVLIVHPGETGRKFPDLFAAISAYSADSVGYLVRRLVTPEIIVSSLILLIFPNREPLHYLLK